MQKINQFTFLEVWNDPLYVSEQLRDVGCRIGNMRVYCGRHNDGSPFIALAGKMAVSVGAEKRGKLSWKVKFSPAGEACFIITMKDQALLNLFAVFAAALISEIEVSQKGIGEVVRNYCDEWKLVFDEPDYLQRAVGIIGELFFLSEMLSAGVADISWNDGSMSPQDFSVGGRYLAEVKTTCSHSSYLVRFHGVEQLHAACGRRLYVIFIRMIRCDGGDCSINSLLSQVPASCVPQTVLERIGKLPEEARTMVFSCTETLVYEVSDDFPRITRNTLQKIPRANLFGDVDYDVNLQGLRGDELRAFLTVINGGDNEQNG